LKILKRIVLRIHLFFAVDSPAFWDRLNLAQKGCLGCLGGILTMAVLLFSFIFHVLGVFYVIDSLHGNQVYECLYPAEEIVGIEIIRIEEDIGLYYVPLESISGLLDTHATKILSLESDQFEPCAEDLADLSASKWWNDPNPYIRGIVLLITYRDGSREWICADGTFYCNLSAGKSSMTRYFFRDEEFKTFLERYGYSER